MGGWPKELLKLPPLQTREGNQVVCRFIKMSGRKMHPLLNLEKFWPLDIFNNQEMFAYKYQSKNSLYIFILTESVDLNDFNEIPEESCFCTRNILARTSNRN